VCPLSTYARDARVPATARIVLGLLTPSRCDADVPTGDAAVAAYAVWRAAASPIQAAVADAYLAEPFTHHPRPVPWGDPLTEHGQLLHDTAGDTRMADATTADGDDDNEAGSVLPSWLLLATEAADAAPATANLVRPAHGVPGVVVTSPPSSTEQANMGSTCDAHAHARTTTRPAAGHVRTARSGVQFHAPPAATTEHATRCAPPAATTGHAATQWRTQ
jgi:hypothetical protein